jgi:hypothetical protein
LLLALGVIQDHSLEFGEHAVELRAGHVHRLQDAEHPGGHCGGRRPGAGGWWFAGRTGVADLLDAGELDGCREAPDHQIMAERAAADRTWTFGHVIVDEAQEL